MRIFQVTPYFYPHLGGLEVYCEELSSKLGKKGHEVHVLTSSYGKMPRFEDKKLYHLHRYPSLFNCLNINPVTVIISDLLKYDCDIIHAHSYIFFTSNQVALIKHIKKMKYILHIHGGLNNEVNSNYEYRLKLKNRIYDPTLGKLTINSADAVISVSKKDVDLLINDFGVDKEKIVWIPNAVNLDNFRKKEKSDINLNVVFVGHLEPWKGVLTFIKVAKMILKNRSDVTFTIIGDGSLYKFIKPLDRDPHFIVLGSIPNSLIPNELEKASILFLPSLFEGVPTICLEAFASGVPVVSSDVGGLTEIITDSFNGFTCSPLDVDTFTNNIMTLLDDDKKRMKYGLNGYELVKNDYGWDKVTDQVEKLYYSI